MKVLTYNIHKGTDSNNKKTLNKMIDFFNKSNADIICLQEVLWQNHVTIRDLTKTYGYFAPNVKKLAFLYGVATYSKYPIIEKKQVLLTSYKEQRGFLHTVLCIDENKLLNVINVHLGLAENERDVQIKEILEYINKLEGETILVGDFNQSDVCVGSLNDVGKYNGMENIPTFKNLGARIDYIFITNNKIYSVDYGVVNTELSDHYPVVSNIEYIK